MLLYKPLYSLWGNFCYLLSVFFKLRIKLRFYCQKPDKHWTFGHRKNDLKDCSSRSLKNIKIYTLQDNGCCTITLDIIPTPQIALQIKQFCLVDLSRGISIIHFVLYCTWLLMLRYHFVSTFDNELCNLWRQCVPGGLLLVRYYSADWRNCQVVNCIKVIFLFCMTMFDLYSQMLV